MLLPALVVGAVATSCTLEQEEYRDYQRVALQSEITNVQYIERGYEDVIGKLRGVGGVIRAVEVPEEDESAVSNAG